MNPMIIKWKEIVNKMGENRMENLKDKIDWRGIGLITIALSSIVYCLYSATYGGIGWEKYSKCSNKIEQKARDYSDKKFYEADKNRDGVLDLNEFYDSKFRKN